MHNVRPGETLAQIALRYEIPIEQIAAENGIADPNRIRAGRELTIGAKQQGVEVIAPGSTLSEYAQRYGTTVAALIDEGGHRADPPHVEHLRAPPGVGRVTTLPAAPRRADRNGPDHRPRRPIRPSTFAR